MRLAPEAPLGSLRVCSMLATLVQCGLGRLAGPGSRGTRGEGQGTMKADGKVVGRSAMLLPGDRMALLSSESFGNLFFFKDLMGEG